MNRRHQLILVLALGLVILSGVGFNSVLMINRPPLTAVSLSVTIGGPFMLAAADGTTVVLKGNGKRGLSLNTSLNK